MKILWRIIVVLSVFFWRIAVSTGAVITLHGTAGPSIEASEVQAIINYLDNTLRNNYDIDVLSQPLPEENIPDFLKNNGIDFLFSFSIEKLDSGVTQLSARAIVQATEETGIGFTVEAPPGESFYNALYQELLHNHLLHTPIPSPSKFNAIILHSETPAADMGNSREQVLSAALAKETTLQWATKTYLGEQPPTSKTSIAQLLSPQERAETNLIAMCSTTESGIEVTGYCILNQTPVETLSVTIPVCMEESFDAGTPAEKLLSTLAPPVILRREESVAYLSRYHSFSLPIGSKWTVFRPLRYNVHPRTKKETLVQEEAVGTVVVQKIVPDSIVVDIIEGNDFIGENLICRPAE